MCLFHMLFDTVSRIQIVKNPTFLLESKGSLSLNDDMNRAKLDWNLLVFFGNNFEYKLVSIPMYEVNMLFCLFDCYCLF